MDTEELDTLKLAAEKLISNENTLNLIGLATDDLDLLSSTGRSKFVSQCRHKSLHIECIDDTVDLCSNGHYYYGICILAICAIPGILFAVSDYINYRGFTFGKLLGNPMLRNWPGIIKLVLLPVYAAFMVSFYLTQWKVVFCLYEMIFLWWQKCFCCIVSYITQQVFKQNEKRSCQQKKNLSIIYARSWIMWGKRVQKLLLF